MMNRRVAPGDNSISLNNISQSNANRAIPSFMISPNRLAQSSDIEDIQKIDDSTQSLANRFKGQREKFTLAHSQVVEQQNEIVMTLGP
jgi:hypothetical protein